MSSILGPSLLQLNYPALDFGEQDLSSPELTADLGRGGEEGRSVRDAVGHFAASSWRGKCPRKSSLKRSASRSRIEPGPSALHTTVWRRAPLAERAQAALTGG